MALDVWELERENEGLFCFFFKCEFFVENKSIDFHKKIQFCGKKQNLEWNSPLKHEKIIVLGILLEMLWMNTLAVMQVHTYIRKANEGTQSGYNELFVQWTLNEGLT